MAIPLVVPSLGESVTEATVGSWRKSAGERVKRDEPVVELESEKATVELPAPADGVLKAILRKQGETVKVGEVLAELDESAAAEAPAAGAAKPGPGVEGPAEMPKMMPAARRMRERDAEPRPAGAGVGAFLLRVSIL